MKETMKRLLTMVHATAELIVDYQRDKAFRDYPITIMALAITSLARWGLDQIQKDLEG